MYGTGYGLARPVVGVAAACLGLAILSGADGPSGDIPEVRKDAKVYVYPKPLTAKDTLTDGPNRKPIPITAETTLVWVDRMPGARYEHPTEYVLISAEGTKVVEGGWWPELNGKRLFGDDGPSQVTLPIAVTGPEPKPRP